MRWPFIVIAVILTLVWVIPVLLPEDSGWRLGLPFRIFYSVIALLGGLFFLLLEAPPPGQPSSGVAVFARITAVYLATVGLLVGTGMAFPQFQIPSEEIPLAETPAQRGEALFFDSATTCILCHAIEGQGGTRGPDLAGLATRAETRVEGMTAEDYVRESILDPRRYVVEGFEAIMPEGLINVVGEDDLEDLLEFLLTLD